MEKKIVTYEKTEISEELRKKCIEYLEITQWKCILIIGMNYQ